MRGCGERLWVLWRRGEKTGDTYNSVEEGGVVAAPHPGLLVRVGPLEESTRELPAADHLVRDSLADPVHYKLEPSS